MREPRGGESGMIELVINEPTPSVNRLHGRHWSAKLRARHRWGWLVREAKLNAKVYQQAAPDKVTVTIERYGPRRLDTDNAIAGMKFLIDALVAEGFAVNDHPAHLTLACHQHVGKPYRTIVRIDSI